MRIGVPRERKDGERRVGLVPSAVATLAGEGHQIVVERGAGDRVGFDDAAYALHGAAVVDDVRRVYECELIVKVKELQADEYPLLQAGTTVFGFAQLGRDRRLQDAVLAARVSCIAYETVTAPDATLPLLAPMSAIAGRLVPLIACSLLMTDHEGSGVLFPGTEGVAPARVVIIGAGVVAREAARLSVDLGASVSAFGRSSERLKALRDHCHGLPRTAIVDPELLAAAIAEADVVVGAVLEPGKLSPTLVTRAMLRAMRPGSVFIDVGIDQGGIAETSRATTLSRPTYVEEGVTHYCVPNMPSLVARTATIALTRATMPYVRMLAQLGVDAALRADAGLHAGLQVCNGAVTHAGLAADRERGMPPACAQA
jgi:alanine dehydrogenase